MAMWVLWQQTALELSQIVRLWVMVGEFSSSPEMALARVKKTTDLTRWTETRNIEKFDQEFRSKQ